MVQHLYSYKHASMITFIYNANKQKLNKLHEYNTINYNS